MCGIAGFSNLSLPPDTGREVLGRMVAAIRHRGPDAAGIHLSHGAGLGHARLSIIDLAAGQQPMGNEDGSVLITFNGEIFNYLELRDELIARGCRFRTRSDTEVILKAYEVMGPACVEKLNGDFAFAIWDETKREMLLARDRMGVRPLFYRQAGRGLYFASEVKALAETPGFSADLDSIALEQIFTFWFPLAPRTPFKEVFELPPGHLMIASARGLELRRYWSLDYPDDSDADRYDPRPEKDIAEELRALLLDATKIRLRADVEVGSYLSGGLDSAIIAAAAKDFVSDRLKTFSVVFDSAEFDESAYQQVMVEALGTRHSSVPCSAWDIAASFPAVIRSAERPILRTAPAPMRILSGLVHRDGIKVVLTGEGADEVFAGYDIFKEAKLRRFCAAQPDSRLRPQLFKRLYAYLPGIQGQNQQYLKAYFSADGQGLDDPLYSHLPRFRSTSGARIFFSPEMKRELKDYDALDDLRGQLPADYSRWHPLCQAQYLEAAHLLPGYILSSQGDRMAMANAVEGRFPFLDHRVVEFASRIPPKLKVRGMREKHILREAMADLLPDDIGNREKQPYRAPDSQSFTMKNPPGWLGRVLAPGALEGAGYFNPKAVEKLVAKCRANPRVGFRDNTAFVGILSTQLWHDAFVERAAPADRAPQAFDKIA